MAEQPKQEKVEPLSKEDKKKVLGVVYANKAEDDRFPGEVIHDRYGGDENKYLRVMATYHGVPISS